MKYNILFNKTLEKFLKDLTHTFPECKESIDKEYGKKDLNILDEKLTQYIKVTELCFSDFLNKNEIVFSEQILLKSIDFKFIFESEISAETIQSIWNYLHTLYLYGYSHIHKLNLIKLMEIVEKNTETSSKENESHPIEILKIMKLSNKSDNVTLDDDIGKQSSEDNFNLPGMSDILDGPIGKLASDIAGEIDIDKLNIEDEDPSKLLDNLMNGKTMENSGLMNIVKDVTTKIQDKISTGNINENELFTEAQQIMNKFNTNDESSPFSMISKMAKDLQSGNSNGTLDPNILNKYGNLMNNLNVPMPNKKTRIDKNKLSLLEKKEKMREKLRKKKELKKTMEKDSTNKTKKLDKILDEVVDEMKI